MSHMTNFFNLRPGYFLPRSIISFESDTNKWIKYEEEKFEIWNWEGTDAVVPSSEG